MEGDSRKKIRLVSLICSNSFKMQEVREIGHKKIAESRGFFPFWIVVIKEDL